MSNTLFIFVMITVLTTCYCGDEIHVWTLSDKLVEHFGDSLTLTSSRESQCERHIHLYLVGLNQSETWAVRMLDATSKLQSGILEGNLVDLGQYDECLEIHHDTGVDGVITGRHCMGYANMDNSAFKEEGQSEAALQQPVTLGFGVCLPSSCSNQEIRRQLRSFLENVNLSLTDYDADRVCNTKEEVTFTTADWAATAIFSTVAALMLLSTIYDLVLEFVLQGKHKRPIFMAFSVYTNGQRILAVNSPSNNRGEKLNCLHGIRAISIIWVMFGHRYFLTSLIPVTNSAKSLEWIRTYHSIIITSATVAVDTFLVLSGLLVSYSYLKYKSSGITFNLSMFYFHRYLRLTPPYAAMVLLQATVFFYLGSGPYWKPMMTAFKEDCQEYWWSALIYLQNYINNQNICVGLSWYLSVDMQMFILSPILLIPLWRWPRYTLWITFLLVLGCAGEIFGISYVYKFSASPYLQMAENDYMKQTHLYLPTHARAGPWILGFILGYFMHTSRKSEFIMSKKLAVATWIFALAVMVATTVGIYPLQQIDHVTNILEASFYHALNRIAWSAVICWIVFACCNNYGGPVNWVLTWTIFQPISRLSYCIYLSHMQVQFILSLSTRSAVHFSDLEMVYRFCGDFCVTLFVSLVWSLAFESPVTVLEKVMLRTAKADDIRTPLTAQTSKDAEYGKENNAFVNDENQQQLNNNIRI